jgi:RNA polymerase sigma-70 factor, ECF subfamily
MDNKIANETIEALQKGEAKAFEKVFIAYFNKIKVFIVGYIKSDADAEELAEELFVNLWINHELIDVTKSFNSYMHTMARNAAINFLKHKYVQQSYINNSNKTESGFTSEDELIAKETSLLIDMAVDKMPEQRKKIYQLSKNQGMKNEEIAVLLNTTKRNVESQLSQALKELRRIISTVRMLFL